MSAPLCPDCRLPLSTARLGPVTVFACRCCGGAWFPEGQLRSVAAAGDRVVRKLAEHLRAGRNAVPPAPSTSPECPECRQPLVSNPSATITGVEVRACIPCKGHWAPMRALQVLASQLTPRVQREEAASPTPPASVVVRKASPLPSWKVTGACPRCLGDRQALECEDVTIEACTDCGGAWIERSAHDGLRRKGQGARKRLLAEIRQIRIGRHGQPQRELHCPTCRVEMRPGPCGPTCAKCDSTFVDFYSLPAFLELSPTSTPAAASPSQALSAAVIGH